MSPWPCPSSAMGDEMGELCVQPKGGGSRGIDSRHLVHKIGEPHEVLVVVEIEAPHGVVDHLITDVDLFCQRLLREIENRSPRVKFLLNLYCASDRAASSAAC